MGIEYLTQLEILQGSLSLAYSMIGILIGLIVILRYYRSKRKELLGVAFAIIFSVIAWAAGGISFLTFIFFDYLLPDGVYFFLNYGFLLLANTFMIYAIVSLISPKSVKKVVMIFLIITITFDVLLIYLIFTHISLVGQMAGKFDSESATIVTLMVLFALITAVVYRILFVRNFSKSESKELQWRGRFILVEAILLVIGSLMDAVVTITITTLIIARIIL
ncbi:MAG TPA: hypothetical protein VGB37_06405, partial [Candidatus Lokiarchaeia archaeon]